MRQWREKENGAYVLPWHQVGTRLSVLHHPLLLLPWPEIEHKLLGPAGLHCWCSRAVLFRCCAQAFCILLILLWLLWIPWLLSVTLGLLLRTVGSVGTLLPCVAWGFLQFCPPRPSLIRCARLPCWTWHLSDRLGVSSGCPLRIETKLLALSNSGLLKSVWDFYCHLSGIQTACRH